MASPNHSRSDKVHFFAIGLGSGGKELSVFKTSKKKPKWILKSLTAIKAMLGHENTPIDILKIDIERSEWPALVDILESGELKQVRQFLVEFHTELRFPSTVPTYRKRLSILAKIEELGFRRFYSHMNPLGLTRQNEYPSIRTSAYEVYYVNTKFSRQQEDLH